MTYTPKIDSAALSVIGRAVNSSGDPADIVADTDGYVLQRSGSTLVFAPTPGAGSGSAASTVTLDTAGFNRLLTSSESNAQLAFDKIDNNIFVDGYGNVGLGATALDAVATGTNNTAIGEGALSTVATVSNTTALGYHALYLNESESNTAIGAFALDANTTGTYNVAIGFDALGANTTGSNNIAIGDSALVSCTGSENTVVGSYAAYSLATGSGNTAIGAFALDAATNVLDSVAIGVNALAQVTPGFALDGAVAIGNAALGGPLNTGAADLVAIGRSALAANTTGARNTAIGSRALDANTTGSRNTALGVDTLSGNTISGENTAVGYEALKINDGYFNTAVGSRALSSSEFARYNVAIGTDALLSSTTAEENIAIGYEAMALTTSGGENIAVGIRALKGNIDGNSNVAIGSLALTANLDGSKNVGVGQYALLNNTSGNDNTVVGAYSMEGNTSGYENCAFGRDALHQNTDGYFNTAIGALTFFYSYSGVKNTALGYRAGHFQEGDSNTYIGYDAGSSATLGNNNIVIGAGAQKSAITASDEITIGNTSHTATRLLNNGAVAVTLSTTSFASTLPFRGPAGTVSAPAFSFSADTDTGIYNSFAGDLSITCDGVRHAVFGDNQIYSADSFSIRAVGASLGDATLPVYAFANDVDTGIYNDSSNAIGFASGGVKSGSISTISNYGRLDLNGTAGSLVELDYAGANRGGIYSDVGAFYLQSSTGIPTIFQVNGSEAGRITTDGYWGINNSSPAAMLDINGDYGRAGLKIASNTGQWAILGSNISSANYMTLLRPGSGSALGYIGGGAGGAISAGTANDLAFRSEENMHFATGGNNVRMMLDSTGLGVGVTPANPLHVKGSGEIAVLETTAATGSNYLRFQNASVDQGYVGFGSGSNNNMSLAADIAGATIIFGTGGSTRVTLADASVTSTVKMLLPDGTGSLPSLTFTANDNTGFYRAGANQIGASCGGNSRISMAGVTSTSDATVTTIITFPTSNNISYSILYQVVARSSTGTTNSYIANVRAKNVGGTVTAVLSTISDNEESATPAVSVSTSGTNVLFRVAGAAATDYSWTAWIDVLPR